jgi:signal transduction histidine kinase
VTSAGAETAREVKKPGKKTSMVGGGIVIRYSAFALILTVIVIFLQILLVNLLRSREVKAGADVAASHMAQQLEQIEDRWTRQIEMFRSLVVVAQPRVDDKTVSVTDSFQALATVLGGAREFEYAVLRLRDSKVLAMFSRSSGPLDMVQAGSDVDGWRKPPGGQGLWRVKVTQLALPGYGAADLLLYFPVNELLLHQLRQPGMKLEASWLGQRFAGIDDMGQVSELPGANGKGESDWPRFPGFVQARAGFRVDLNWPRAPDGLVIALEAEPRRLLPLWAAVSVALMLLVFVVAATWIVMGGWLRREVVGPLSRLAQAVGMADPRYAVAPLLVEGVAEVRAVTSILNSTFVALGRSQHELAEGQQRFRDFAGLNADLMWESNAEGNVEGVWGNLSIFPDIDPCLLSPDDRIAVANGIDAATTGWSDYRDAMLARRPIRHAVIERQRKSERRSFYSVSASPRSTSTGRFLGFRGVVSEVTNVIELEGRMRDSERRMLAVLDAAPGVVYLRSLTDMSVAYISSSVEEQTGLTEGHIVATPGLWNSHVHPEDVHLWRGVRREIGERGVASLRYRFIRKDGATRWFSDELRRVGEGEDVVGVCIDVTEQVAMDQRVQASQKMDAIGQLTGGLAHDFNNILGIVISSLEVVAGKMCTDASLTFHVDVARTAALRGADISRSLLAVARRQVLAPRTHDINDIVRENLQLVRVAVGSDTVVSLRHSPQPLTVNLDATGLVQCLVNIAVNARDAMHGKVGGRQLEIKVGQGNHPGRETDSEMPQAAYAFIEIRDSGNGMEPEVLKHAFEPFFSTKSAEKGTGLGLAMVYGFVHQSGGDATIGSVPGSGTTVTMFFPLIPIGDIVEPDSKTPSIKSAALPCFSQDRKAKTRVLVVDDEEDLRSMACEMLNLLGCDAVDVEAPQQALDVLASESFNFLFTDVTMPGMNGVELAREAIGRCPEIRIVLTSGYSVEPMENIDFPHMYLQKPYLFADLRRIFCDQAAGDGPPMHFEHVKRMSQPGGHAQGVL